MNPEKEKPAKGLGLLSVFFSSTTFVSELGVTAGTGVLPKEKPPNGLLSAPDLGVPKSDVGITEEAVVVSVFVDAANLILESA